MVQGLSCCNRYPHIPLSTFWQDKVLGKTNCFTNPRRSCKTPALFGVQQKQPPKGLFIFFIVVCSIYENQYAWSRGGRYLRRICPISRHNSMLLWTPFSLLCHQKERCSLLGAPGIRSKDATNGGSWPYY